MLQEKRLAHVRFPSGIRRLRPRLQKIHIVTATEVQIPVANMSVCQRDNCGKNFHVEIANPASPEQPIAAPAASTPAARRPRTSPLTPACRFFRRCCFSIRDAPAGNMAGNARNSPPTPGPNFSAISPASSVTAPPNTKRVAYSLHVVVRMGSRLSFTIIPLPEGPPKAKRTDKP